MSAVARKQIFPTNISSGSMTNGPGWWPRSTTPVAIAGATAYQQDRQNKSICAICVATCWHLRTIFCVCTGAICWKNYNCYHEQTNNGDPIVDILKDNLRKVLIFSLTALLAWPLIA